jgi:hypothetical protein
LRAIPDFWEPSSATWSPNFDVAASSEDYAETVKAVRVLEPS